MTANPCKPTAYEPTAIEKATAQVMADLGNCITVNFLRFAVRGQIGTGTLPPNTRRILRAQDAQGVGRRPLGIANPRGVGHLVVAEAIRLSCKV